MIRTAVFAWDGRNPCNLSIWQLFFWTAAVHHAAKHFDEIILMANPAVQSLLLDKYELPFTDWLLIPTIPDEVKHVYEIPKLLACAAFAESGVPFLTIDYDAFIRKPLPKEYLSAPVVAEFLYDARLWQRELNSAMPIPRLPEPRSCCCTGILGGNDTYLIGEIATRSIEAAYQPDNSRWLRTQDGYRCATVLGEMAFGTEAEVTPLMPNASAEDYRKSGFIHVAGAKTDAGKVAQTVIRLQYDFPNELRRTAMIYDSCKSTD